MATNVNVSDSRQLGTVVRAVRIAAGLSQVDAAALCGVSGPFISGLEGGKPTTRLGLVLQVCRGLGIALSARVPLATPEFSEVSRRRRVPKARR
ncbi:MAG: helix-turn-helix transcriptional regulator [Proteobacteria bacterium]|nr:helix-turn-helix transcriptional regulator [Pseudomonadota bacterium]